MPDQLGFRRYRAVFDSSIIQRWQKIFLKMPARKYPKRTFIINEGEVPSALYYVIDGLVEFSYIDEEGTEHLIDLLGEGSILGLHPFFSKFGTLGHS